MIVATNCIAMSIVYTVVSLFNRFLWYSINCMVKLMFWAISHLAKRFARFTFCNLCPRPMPANVQYTIILVIYDDSIIKNFKSSGKTNLKSSVVCVVFVFYVNICLYMCACAKS